MNSKNYYNQSFLWDRSLLPEDLDKLHILNKIIPEDVKTILDVGCGNGAVTNLLPDTFEITGIDFSEEALKHFKHTKVLGDAGKLPFEDASFDMVITMDTLEHIKPDIYKQSLAEIERVSKKYILVICPHNEKLYERQTRCEFCETVFHVHWHLRSIKAKDLLGAFDSFRPEMYSFFGGKWVYSKNKLFTKLRQVVGDQWTNFHGAVCPMCGTEQQYPNNKTFFENTINTTFKRLENSELTFDEPQESEIVVFYKKEEIQDKVQIDFVDSDKLSIFIEADEDTLVELNVSHRFDIALGDTAQTRATTFISPDQAYIIVNENTDWGKVVEIEGKTGRCFEDQQGTDGHAIFILPVIPEEREFSIEYFDRGEEKVYVQVYDIHQGYQNIGQLDLTKSNTWKTSSYTIPDTIKPGDEGWICRLVTESHHPTESHPIAKIYSENSKYSKHIQLSPKRSVNKIQEYEIPHKWNIKCFMYTLSISSLKELLHNAYIMKDIPYLLLENNIKPIQKDNRFVYYYNIPNWALNDKQKFVYLGD